MIHLTPEILETAYEYLRSTQPFRRWKLPAADDVEFWVSKNRGEFGCYVSNGKRYPHHRIHLSPQKCGTTAAIMETMAHEMIHIRDQLTNPNWIKDSTPNHGKAFRRMADQVCKIHGFDRRTF